jgi:glycosyltransferase involved in cell wall biosynthesis
MTIFINGKFTSQPLSGTQRYAEEICKKLLRTADINFKLVVPKKVKLPTWLPKDKIVRGNFSGALFDQITVPWLARKGLLISLSGPYSVFHPEQLHVIHDVGFLKYPDHYSRWFYFYYKVMYKLSVRFAKHLVTVSKFSKREIAREFSTRRRISIIPGSGEHFADFSSVRPRNFVPKDFVLLVGAPTRRKNSVQALEVVRSGNLAAVVVGNLETVAHITAFRSLPNCEFLTSVTDFELKWLYENCIALLVPSLYEGFGLPVLEAQWSGAIVIANDVTALPEVLGRSGYRVNFGHSKDVLEVIRRIRSSQERRKQEHLLIMNRSYYSWERSASSLVSLIKRK